MYHLGRDFLELPSSASLSYYISQLLLEKAFKKAAKKFYFIVLSQNKTFMLEENRANEGRALFWKVKISQ